MRPRMIAGVSRNNPFCDAHPKQREAVALRLPHNLCCLPNIEECSRAGVIDGLDSVNCGRAAGNGVGARSQTIRWLYQVVAYGGIRRSRMAELFLFVAGFTEHSYGQRLRSLDRHRRSRHSHCGHGLDE